jgi:hypothetical protein
VIPVSVKPFNLNAMKNVTILVIACLCINTLQAQQITEKHLNFSGKESINLNITIADSIRVQTWNKNEVYVSASVNINENRDNEAYLISFEESDNLVKVDANFSENYFKGKNSCCTETDIYWQVFIPENAGFVLETINADITITGETKEMRVNSISGFIDLALPEKQAADIEFSTITGTIYSDHSFALSGIHSKSRALIREQLNKGGPLIKLETISGDIFFRKTG